MSKLKLTKGELKKQRDSLEQFRHYLPTLQLKKQQLQMKIAEAQKEDDGKQVSLEEEELYLSQWAGLFADSGVDLLELIKPARVLVEMANIAGANVPVLKEITFPEMDYDFYATPFWYESGILNTRDLVTLLIELRVINKRIEILSHELRVTTQRVNLFEKVKIPECRDNIRTIRIYLGDQQAIAVGISKVAKKKIEQKEMAAV